nr:retinitis pigmentosa 1-like 1 protein [Meriones unguiculatus]
MSSTPGDTKDAPVPAPSHRQCLLPSVAHTPSVTEVTPAKKITFLKRGDPQFAGVRLAVHQRTFKTFSALMDELSQRMPLSFGVRSVTTPRGLHGLSALDQLQDGGCYLCSDRKPSKTPREPGRLQRQRASAGQSQGLEAPETSSSWKGPMAPRRLTLVKNGDPRCQQTVVLSHKNTRNLAAFLSKASELLRFPVKQVYTPRGKKVESLQTLLDGPSMVVCAGNEAFRRLERENDGGNRTRTLSGVHARSDHGSWGPNTKQSVMHLRARSGGRLRQFSLISERSAPSDHPASSHQAWMGPALDRCPQDTPAPCGSLVAADDVEKKVCMNEDGSLSVEMKLRFQLLGEDTLRWSQRVGNASVFTAASGEGQVLREAGSFCCRQEGHPWDFLDPGAQGLGPRDGGCRGAFDVSQQSRPSYDIWRNPLMTPEGAGPTARRRWGLAKLSGGRRHWSQRASGRKGHDQDDASPVSTPRHPRSAQPGSCCPWTPDGETSSDTLHPISSASSQSGAESGDSPCREDTGPRGLRPETQGIERALSDTPASAESPEEPSECGGRHHRGSSQARVMASQGQATQGDDSPCIPTQSLSPLSHIGLQTEKCREGTRCQEATGEPAPRLPLVPGHHGSQDTQSNALPAPASAPAERRQRKQKRPAGGVRLPCVSVPCQVAQKGHAKQCHYCRDTLSSPDTAMQISLPQEREQACPGGPAPQFSPNSPSAGNQASGTLQSPFSSSPDFQDPEATILASDSDCVSGFHNPSTHSAEPAGDTECPVHSLAPTPVHREEIGGLWDEAETISSASTLLDRWPETEDPRTHHDCCLLGAASSTLTAPSDQMQGLIPEACLGDSSFCPTAPKEQTCSRKEPQSSSSTSSDHSGAGGHAGPRRTLLGTSPGFRGSLEEQEEDGGVTPSALPHSSPDAMVREWLGNIPEKPVLMTYEMASETAEVVNDSPEGPKEDLGDGCSLKVLGELAQTGPQLPEGVTDEHAEPAGILPGTGSVSCKLGGDPHHDEAPGEGAKAPAEAGMGERATVDHGVRLYALPSRVSASTQIMKALLGSKPGRPSSLPEVSTTVAQRLSCSARTLIACLARLHFFDEALGPPDGKVRLEESPKYQEMVSLFQSLWPGSEVGKGQLDMGLRRLTSHQGLLGTEVFTPTSSSGVDISSGSGGSGESNVPCAMDNTTAPKKIDLPLKIPPQRPDSKNQGYPEGVNPSTVSSGSQARGCATSREESGKGGRMHVWDKAPEKSAETTMLGEEAQPEEREWKAREGLQEGSVHGKGLLEEEATVCSQGMLGAGSRDGEGSPEDTRVPKDGAGTDAASGEPWPLLRREEEPTESSHHFSESKPNVSESESVHILEQGLEEMSRADATGHEQACMKASSGTRERDTPPAHKGSLDPDPIWVSKLLKKIEKAFMAHLADATAELRARWSLHDNSLLDQMVTELEQDVGRRLQASIFREVRKIQSRAGRMASEPPRETLRGQTSLQTEQRRRRIQGLRNFSAFPAQGHLSFTLEDGFTLGTASGTRPGTGAVGDEFCPCEVCLKKMNHRFPKDATVVSSAPVRRAFDLQQILQSKKGGGRNEEAMEVAPQKTGMMLSQEDLSTVQGADGKQELKLTQGPGIAEGEEGEGRQRLRGEVFLKAEGAGCHVLDEEAAAEKEGELDITAPPESQQLEEGGIEKGETSRHQSFRDRSASWASRTHGGHSVEVPEASREREPEVEGGNQDGKESSSCVSSAESQRRTASENTSLDQDGGLQNHHGRPGSRSHCAAHSSRVSSLGNCSQVSQTVSEGDFPSGDLKCTTAENSKVLHAERKVTMMYLESSSSEQEEAPSSPRPPKQGKGEGWHVENERTVGSLACTPVGSRVDGFGQEDLDF